MYSGCHRILRLLPYTPDFNTYSGFHGVPRFSPLLKVTHNINDMLLKLALNIHGKSNIIRCGHLLFYYTHDENVDIKFNVHGAFL